MKKKYIEEKKDFILLITGSADNDYAAERAADPDLEIVHHKLCYVPVYSEFKELKHLQIKLRQSDYSFGRKVCCAIDISEWIGHEDDEFFIITLKYLHDHRSGVDYIFTVGEHSKNDVRKLFFKLSCYMSGMIYTDKTFMSRESLGGLIETYGIERNAAQLLSELVMSDKMDELRTYPVVKMMCDEICAYAGSGELAGLKELALYLDKTGSLPSILNSDLASDYSGKARKLGGFTDNSRRRKETRK